MSDERSNSPTSPRSHRRRASMTPGASFSELFSSKSGNQPTGTPAHPGPIASAAANAQGQRRRMSITTLGLSGSPTQTSPFANRAARQGSLSSSVGSGSPNFEEAVMEEGESEHTGPMNTPASPFARRVSFGAQALRDVRSGSANANGRYTNPLTTSVTRNRRISSASTMSPGGNAASAASTHKNYPQTENSNPSSRQTGEGFNWTEALRNRAERAPSVSGFPQTSPHDRHASVPGDHSTAYQNQHHQRAASIASMEQPVREMPKQPKQQQKPDFFQEKILKADFMD
ncbi:hypothetical protein FQN54_000633 [Arachnomyces sp. PD_36]|nr:hypothetical protein FQN54_000633 [Arachnomyces sp. PD_36]